MSWPFNSWFMTMTGVRQYDQTEFIGIVRYLQRLQSCLTCQIVILSLCDQVHPSLECFFEVC